MSHPLYLSAALAQQTDWGELKKSRAGLTKAGGRRLPGSPAQPPEL